MSNPVFPAGLAALQDSAHFSDEQEDPAIKSEMEGAYVVTRARHTRAPRRTFTTGFTEISNANKQALQAFYAQVRGGSVIFDYVDPVSAKHGAPVTYAVRFASGPLKWTVKSIGAKTFWSTTFTLQEA